MPAPGSCRRSNAARVRGFGGPFTSGPQARSFSDMPGPALCPGHALLLAFPPTGRLPSTLSAADAWSALFEASSVLRSRPTPPAFRVGDALPSFPTWPGAAAATAGSRRSPRFRRGPFVRDVVSDPGRATMPRMTASLMLRSTAWNVSAPATSSLSWLNTHPTRSLCTLRRGRRLPQRNTRYQAGATPYLGRTSTGWTAPASPGAPEVELAVVVQEHAPLPRRRARSRGPRSSCPDWRAWAGGRRDLGHGRRHRRQQTLGACPAAQRFDGGRRPGGPALGRMVAQAREFRTHLGQRHAGPARDQRRRDLDGARARQPAPPCVPARCRRQQPLVRQPLGRCPFPWIARLCHWGRIQRLGLPPGSREPVTKLTRPGSRMARAIPLGALLSGAAVARRPAPSCPARRRGRPPPPGDPTGRWRWRRVRRGRRGCSRASPWPSCGGSAS